VQPPELRGERLVTALPPFLTILRAVVPDRCRGLAAGHVFPVEPGGRLQLRQLLGRWWAGFPAGCAVCRLVGIRFSGQLLNGLGQRAQPRPADVPQRPVRLVAAPDGDDLVAVEDQLIEVQVVYLRQRPPQVGAER
jgi:hypothetical protein